MSTARDPEPAKAADRRETASGFARDTAVLTAGMVLSQLTMLAAMPIWSRQYGPADLAALGLWSAVVSVVSMLLLLRYDACIVIARDDAEASSLVRLIVSIAAAGGLLLALAAWSLPASWIAAAGLAPLGHWLPLAVLAGAAAAMMAAGLAWANRRRRYLRMSAARVAMAFVAAVLGVWFASFETLPGLLLAHAAAAGAALCVLDWRLRGPGDTRAAMTAAAHRHADAPRYLWPSSMIDAVTQQIPLWLTALWFGTEAAGQFSLAWRAVALPMLMLASAAGSVFYQRFAAVWADPGRTPGSAPRAVLAGTWRRFALAAAFPVAILVLFGEPLFAWAFGPTWTEAGHLAAVMAPMLGVMLVSSTTSGALIVLGMQKWAPLFGIAMLCYRPACFAVGAAFGSLALALGLWVACEILAILAYNGLILRRLAAPVEPT